MKTAKVELEGICKIMFNRFTEAAKDQLEKGSSGKKLSKDQQIEEAHTKIYTNEKGIMGLPAPNVKKCMLEGCRMAKIKMGRSSAVQYLRATVFFEPDFIPFSGKLKKPAGIYECTGRRPPRTGGRCVIRWPYLESGWKLAFQAHIVDDRIDPSLVHQSLMEAGLYAGLCDHRPEFGRFKVNQFELM